MGYRILRADEAFWRPSNAMKVLNTDLAGQVEATKLGARLWRLRPGQASTKHRHFKEEEFYVLLEGRGRIRIGEESLELGPLDSILVEPETVRQVFNDTDADALWLVVGAPPEFTNTVEMDPAELAKLYPETPRTLPPELGGGEFDPDA